MATWFRSYFPSPPKFTEKDIPDLAGRVYIITGGTGGVGLELAKILYHANAGRVYLLGRSATSGAAAVQTVLTSAPHPSAERRRKSKPNVEADANSDVVRYLHLDLADLSSIKATAEAFLSRETRLDVLWHNAAVMLAPEGSTSPQGHELTFATNVLGPFLLQHFLTPILLKTAETAAPGTVRTCWAGSGATVEPPGEDGIQWDDLALRGPPFAGSSSSFRARTARYMQSKAANAILAREMARRHPSVVSCAFNPGALRTGIARNAPGPLAAVHWAMSSPARCGALTEAFAGLAPSVGGGGGGNNGCFVVPFGAIGAPVAKVEAGLRERGSGERLWKVCEELVGGFY